MAQQTAVGWLIEQLQAPCRGIPSHVIEQAKQMEKERMVKFAFDFYYNLSNKMNVPTNLITENREHAEQYYKETYGKQ